MSKGDLDSDVWTRGVSPPTTSLPLGWTTLSGRPYFPPGMLRPWNFLSLCFPLFVVLRRMFEPLVDSLGLVSARLVSLSPSFVHLHPSLRWS